MAVQALTAALLVWQKGCGYHLDLFWVGILMAACSFMGLPWYVAATVISIAHIDSLKMESESSAPGEQPQFLGVRLGRQKPSGASGLFRSLTDSVCSVSHMQRAEDHGHFGVCSDRSLHFPGARPEGPLGFLGLAKRRLVVLTLCARLFPL